MKISRKKIFILFIFVIFILIETACYAVYAISEEKEKTEIICETARLNEEEETTLKLINEYRKQNGLKELKAISKLQEAAYLKADDLVQNEYFSHTSETLGTPFEMLQANGVEYKVAGENLAGNTTPERAVEAWINSKAHRENILDEDYEYTGIVAIDSPVYGKVYVQLFIGI